MINSPGIANGIWSDMEIETTYMLYGHSWFGIIGFTLKPETLKTCSSPLRDLSDTPSVPVICLRLTIDSIVKRKHITGTEGV